MKTRKPFIFFTALTIACLAYLFREQFKPGMTGFSNDGPYGAMHAAQAHYPQSGVALWQDLNWIGGRALPHQLIGVTAALMAVCARPDAGVAVVLVVLAVWLATRSERRFLVALSALNVSMMVLMALAFALRWVDPWETEWSVLMPFSGAVTAFGFVVLAKPWIPLPPLPASVDTGPHRWPATFSEFASDCKAWSRDERQGLVMIVAFAIADSLIFLAFYYG